MLGLVLWATGDQKLEAKMQKGEKVCSYPIFPLFTPKNLLY